MGKSGCVACKSRRRRCDGSRPICVNCMRMGRECRWNSIHLSWPQRADGRRMLVGPRTLMHAGGAVVRTSSWVNLGVGDIDLCRRILGPTRMGDTPDEPSLPALPTPIRWTPSPLNSTDGELLQYFKSVAIHSMATCDEDGYRFLGFYCQLALTDASASSTAVMRSILAVSGMHRYGLRHETLRLQAASLRALSLSARTAATESEVVQHIASNMLLCAFEIQAGSGASASWLSYVKNAEGLSGKFDKGKKDMSGDVMGLLGWVQYHEVMGRFSARHWRPQDHALGWDLVLPGEVPGSESPQLVAVPIQSQATHIKPPDPHSQEVDHSGHMLLLIRLLGELFDSVIPPSHPRYHSPVYREYILSIQKKFATLFEKRKASLEIQGLSEELCGNNVLYLSALAALIYHERVTTNFSGQSDRLNAWTRVGFTTLAKMEACKLPFPLLIFGLEATNDEQRILILDIIDRTARKTDSWNTRPVLRMLELAWSLDDLWNQEVVSYVDKLNVVIGSCPTIPAFV
ncbi:hypothetical protein GQ53DRAFT_750082 [Thozetella sp. PMI_491]|nr:hypothetical protein GQ53DRAFT_750082 [Thozetella sp. PMI_491]